MPIYNIELPDGNIASIESDLPPDPKDYGQIVRAAGLQGKVADERLKSVPSGVVFERQGKEGKFIADAGGRAIPFIPFEQRQFINNIASNPRLDPNEVEEITNTYIDSYYDSLRDEKSNLGRIKDSFVENAKNSFFSATTLGATIKGNQLGTTIFGERSDLDVDSAKAGLSKLESELKRREEGGERKEPKGFLSNVLSFIGSGDSEGLLQQLPDAELKERIEYQRKRLESVGQARTELEVPALIEEAKRVAKFDALDSSGIIENTAAVTGALLGSAPTPESLIAPAKGVTQLQSGLRNAAIGGGVNLATSPLVQNIDEARGLIEDPTVKNAVIDTALGTTVGFLLGGGGRAAFDSLLNIKSGALEGKTPTEAINIIRKANEGKTDTQIVETFLEIDNPELRETLQGLILTNVKKTVDDVKQARVSDPTKGLVDDLLEDINSTPPESMKKQRGFVERIKNFGQFQDARKILEDDPTFRFDPQKVANLKKSVTEMTDGELVESFTDVGLLETISSNDNLSTIAGAEMLERARLKGDDTRPIIDMLARRGTTIGQLLNQYKEIKNATPEGMLSVVKRNVERANRTMSPQQDQQFIDMAEKLLNAQKRLRDSENALHVDFKPETVEAFRTAQDDVGSIKRDITRFSDELVPQSILSTTGKAVQGNLLTPLSIAANVIGNTSFAIPRVAVNAVKVGLDALYSQVRGVPRTSRLSPQQFKESARGALNGISEATKEFFTGPSNSSYRKAEVQRGFRPLRSAIQAITGDGLALDKNGNVKLSDRARKGYEALVGGPAEVMFRFLNIGDKPFRRAREASLIQEQIELRGLKGDKAERFRLLLGDTINVRKDIQEEALEAVFMQGGSSAKYLNKMLDENVGLFLPDKIKNIPVVKDALKFAGRINVPFRQFPINYVSTALNFAIPPLAMANATVSGAMGNRRKAFQHVAEAMVGATVYSATNYLYEKGLIAPPASQDSTKRNIQYETMGPGRLNISGLNRLMEGGDPKYRLGDMTVDYTRSFGIAGVLMGIRSESLSLDEDAEIKKDEENINFISDTFQDMTGVASFAFDQSFLSGTSAFLEAIRDPNPDNRKIDLWLTNMFKAVSSVAIPNTVEAVARTQYDYIPNLRGDDLEQSIKNLVEFKTSPLVRMMGYKPKDFDYRRDLFGQPIKRTPAGRNPIVFNMLDVTKAGRKEQDPFRQRLLEMYQATGDADVYPSVPEPRITYDGVTVKLDVDDWDTLQTLVGDARLKLAEPMLEKFYANPTTAKLTDTQKSALITPILNQIAYAEGSKVGRDQFMQIEGMAQKYFPEQFGLPSDPNRKKRLSHGRKLDDTLRELSESGINFNE